MKRYEKIKNTRAAKADTNNCSVIALSIACRVKYKIAGAYARIQGRQNGKGMYTRDILNTAKALGCVVEEINVSNLYQKNGSRYTMKTIGKKFKSGYYLVFVKGHVAAMVNGEIEDWTQNRKHHVINVAKITKPRNK